MKNDSLRIVIFAPYYRPHRYGLVVYLEEFVQFLAPRVKKITIVTPDLPGGQDEHENIYDNVEIIKFPAFYLVFNYPAPKIWSIVFWKTTIGLFKKIKYDLVVSNIRFFPITAMAILYSKIRGIKCMHIEHVSNSSILSSKFKTFTAKMYDRSIGALIFKSADINVAPSSDVRKFINKFDKRYVPVIFNGLNLEYIDKIESSIEIKKEYGDKIILCYPGRLSKWKGVENSVEIVKSLPEEIKKKIIYLIAGNGEDFDRISKLIAGDKCIKLLGEISRSEVISMLKIADIYIHPAMLGGALANSLLEAMYCRCAVVATPNEGAKDVIVSRKNGVIVNSMEEMKEELIVLIENEDLRKKYGESASLTVSENFTWCNAGNQYLRLMGELMARSR